MTWSSHGSAPSPSSQPTPTRADDLSEAAGFDEQTTHYAPRTPARDDDRTTYAPRPSLDADETDRTHYAPRPNPVADEDDRTHYASRSGSGWSDDADRTNYAPHSTPVPPPAAPHLAAHQRPHSDDRHRDRQQRDSHLPGAWAPSNWHLPEDRFEAPPPEKESSRRRPSLVKLLSGAVAVVLLAVLTGVVYVQFIRKPPVDDAVKVPDASSSASKAKVLRGDDVVRQYLAALAAGDVAKALSYGPTGGNGSQALLSKNAYAASLKAAPLSNIDVPTTDANASEIPASYTLGTQQVKTSFRVIKQDNGSWQLEKTTATFRMQGTKVENVPIKINGVAVNWETPLELVPGSYVLSTGLPFIAFDAGDSLTLLNLNYSDITVHNAAPALTEQGQKALIDAGRRTLQACASRKEMRPANCPNGLTSAAKIDPATIEWKLVGDPFEGVRPGLSATDQSRAEVNLVATFTFSGRVAGTQRQINENTYRYTANVSAVMSVANAQQVKPEWKS